MFPLVKIRLTFKALQDIQFPRYAGSSLRGVFGKSLRRVSCLTPKTKCTACAMAVNCPYASVFENGYLAQGKNKDVPNPYIIEPMATDGNQIAQGTYFSFEQVLFGTALDKLSYILLAWVKCGNAGFTRERIPAKLLRIEQVEDDGNILLLHDLEDSSAETDKAKIMYELPRPHNTDRLKVELETPLRIHHLGHPIVPEAFTAQDFLVSVLRRQKKMAQHIVDFPVPDMRHLRRAIEGVTLENADLHWYDWKRYSSRQKSEIALGGIVGHFTLCGDLTELYPYIKVGEYFHCGKSTVMGLGKYHVVKHCE